MKAMLVVFVAMAFLIPDLALAVDVADASALPAEGVSADVDEGFVIYLETSEVPAEQIQHYLEGLDECSHLLNNGDWDGARKILEALAGDTKLDHGVCDELGHRLDTTLAILGKKKEIEKANGDLQSSLANPDQSPEDVADALRKQSEAQRDKNTSADLSAASNTLSAHLTENYLKDAQTREQIAANERDYSLLVDQCRGDFSSYIEQLKANGHYRQVLLAVEGYRWLFPGLSDPPQMKATLAQCRDRIASIEQTIAAAKEGVTQGRLVAASGQLMAAYRLGVDDPQVLGVELTQKKAILTFILDDDKLHAAIQAKDAIACENLLPQMAREANDFDARPIQSFAEVIRKKSQLLVNQAKSEIEQGHTASALEDFQEASANWPGNPGLQGGAVEFILREQAKTESVRKFDVYWSQGDYASIAGGSQEFTPWLQGDTRRLEMLKNAEERIQRADLAIAQAAALQSAGQDAQAWEALEIASREWPANRRLNELKLVIALAAPDFVHAIGRAEEAEKRNDLGLSLSWYAAAQSYSARSRLAREGVDRLSSKILH